MMDALLLVSLGGFVVVAAATAVRVVRRRRKPAPWPTPSYEEVMETDAILRKLSGADEAEKRAERRKQARADASARARRNDGGGDLP